MTWILSDSIKLCGFSKKIPEKCINFRHRKEWAFVNNARERHNRARGSARIVNRGHWRARSWRLAPSIRNLKSSSKCSRRGRAWAVLSLFPLILSHRLPPDPTQKSWVRKEARRRFTLMARVHSWHPTSDGSRETVTIFRMFIHSPIVITVWQASFARVLVVFIRYD